MRMQSPQSASLSQNLSEFAISIVHRNAPLEHEGMPPPAASWTPRPSARRPKAGQAKSYQSLTTACASHMAASGVTTSEISSWWKANAAPAEGVAKPLTFFGWCRAARLEAIRKSCPAGTPLQLGGQGQHVARCAGVEGVDARCRDAMRLVMSHWSGLTGKDGEAAASSSPSDDTRALAPCAGIDRGTARSCGQTGRAKPAAAGVASATASDAPLAAARTVAHKAAVPKRKPPAPHGPAHVAKQPRTTESASPRSQMRRESVEASTVAASAAAAAATAAKSALTRARIAIRPGPMPENGNLCKVSVPLKQGGSNSRWMTEGEICEPTAGKMARLQLIRHYDQQASRKAVGTGELMHTATATDDDGPTTQVQQQLWNIIQAAREVEGVAGPPKPQRGPRARMNVPAGSKILVVPLPVVPRYCSLSTNLSTRAPSGSMTPSAARSTARGSRRIKSPSSCRQRPAGARSRCRATSLR